MDAPQSTLSPKKPKRMPTYPREKAEHEEYTEGAACPIETQDVAANLANRQKAIEVANYGPLDPSEPNTEYCGASILVPLGNCVGYSMACKPLAIFLAEYVIHYFPRCLFYFYCYCIGCFPTSILHNLALPDFVIGSALHVTCIAYRCSNIHNHSLPC